MAAFDPTLFNSLAGGSSNPIGAIGTSFGIPSCLLQLGMDVLSILPSSLLAAIAGGIQAGMALADGVVKAIFAKIRDWLGITEWDTEDGPFSFVSKIFGEGSSNGLTSILAVMGGMIGAAGALSQLYSNYLMIEDQIDAIKDCIKSYRDFLKIKNGFSEEILDPQAFEDFRDGALAVEKAQAEGALAFIEAGARQLEMIGSVLAERAADPSKEPMFSQQACSYFSGIGLPIKCEPPVDPASGVTQQEIFRLVFGPPKSSAGQFILSQDGLYFDSQTSGIVPALTYINQKKAQLDRAQFWKFMQDPNLGGRGKSFSINDLKSYVNTVLDPDIIDDSPYLQNYYNRDGFLQELIGNKNKRIYDLSSQISDLESGNAPLSVILNFKQSLISENINLTKKINKRKKQIQLAVTASQISIFRKPGYIPPTYLPGEVPINDFSYLADLNLDINVAKQKAMSFSQIDVSGIISPIELQTNYYIPKVANTRNSTVEHLILAENGDGAIIFDGSSVSSVDGVILQTENSLTTDGLFAMYNFLDTDVEPPSSTFFNVRNSASEGDELYAQLVADDSSKVYSRGLGIPYLQGITRNSNDNTTIVSALGSFVKLPDTRKFNDLLYNLKGATIDFWTYVPGIFANQAEGNVSSLYRLVLSNENVGFAGEVSSTDTEYVSYNNSINVVKGFMMGFSRDRRLTTDEPASNSSPANPATKTVFFVAPTQSVTPSSLALINRSFYDNTECISGTSYHCAKHPLTSGMGDCSGEFCHIAVTFNPIDDEVSFYFDGDKIMTSSMSYAFGIPKHRMLNVPTFAIKTAAPAYPNGASFEYSQESLGVNAPESLKSGPDLDTYYTPWIVGGGYTDGMAGKGNFMGGTYGGIISGLRGYLGSIKFYDKSLRENEVLNNYNTHKNFFKNIDITKL